MKPEEITKLIEPLPADDYDSAQKTCRQLLGGGAATLSQLVRMVGDDFGDPKGVKPKYALHGLAHYASRPGNDGDRKLLAETLAREVEGEHADELKAFVVRQLQLCGRADDVPALAKLPASDRLCDPAAQALAAIGGNEALKALKESLKSAQGERKTAISQAIETIESSSGE